MVTVQVIATGEILDVIDGKITYVKQVAALGDITTANASYSWVFEIPKSPRNTKILENLGIVGDTSMKPYRKVYCRIIDNGTAINHNGLLNIKSVNHNYDAFIQEGIIDFYNDVQIDKIGEVIDLSLLRHQNTVTNIIASWDLETYRYIMADYKVPPLPEFEAGVTNLNPFGLAPSVNVKWLWDKIMAHYGWTYETSVDMSNLWMSYPFNLGFSGDNVQLRGKFFSNIAYAIQYVPPRDPIFPQDFLMWFDNTLNEDQDGAFVVGVNAYTKKIVETGVYRITFLSGGHATFEDQFGRDYTTKYWTEVYVNGLPTNQSQNTKADSWLQEETTWEGILQIGDLVTLHQEIQLWEGEIDRPRDIFGFDGGIEPIQYRNVKIWYAITNWASFSTLGVQTVDFREALIKYLVKDFFKEIMVRYHLTAFADSGLKHIKFMTFDERINAPVLDWTGKYIKRESETYVYEDYGQNNLFTHKYNNDGDNYNDGNLKVNNENLDVSKTLYESQAYARADEITKWSESTIRQYYVNVFPMFEVEVSRDENGVLTGNWKGLSNRYYFMTSEKTRRDIPIYILNQLVTTGFPIAGVQNTDWIDIIKNRYNRSSVMLSDTRVHKISLQLSRVQVAALELDKRYYFEQENNYYLLDSLTYNNGENTSGEFVRIKNNPTSAVVVTSEGGAIVRPSGRGGTEDTANEGSTTITNEYDPLTGYHLPPII